MNRERGLESPTHTHERPEEQSTEEPSSRRRRGGRSNSITQAEIRDLGGGLLIH